LTSNPSTAWRPLSPATSRRAASGLLAPLALAAACLALLAPSAHAAPPTDFVGTQAFGGPTDAQLARLGKAKVRVFRAQMGWATVESQKPTGCTSSACSKHTYDWRPYDRMFERAASNGVRILPVLLGSPRWAVSDERWVPVRGKPGYRDWKRQAFYDFAKAAARRYGPNGAFWAERASLGKRTPGSVRARYWQVWNEPNLKNYWWNKPSPSEYAHLLRNTAPALKRGGGSSVLVVAAGLPWSQYAPMKPPEFIQKMFASRATADIVAIHPYGKTPNSVMSGVRDARRAAKSRPLWLTEFGWSSSGPSSTFRVSESTQARYLRETYRKLLAERSSLGIHGAVWFNLADKRPPSSSQNAWYYHTGLFRTSGAHKRSWKAMNCVTGAGTCSY